MVRSRSRSPDHRVRSRSRSADRWRERSRQRDDRDRHRDDRHRSHRDRERDRRDWHEDESRSHRGRDYDRDRRDRRSEERDYHRQDRDRSRDRDYDRRERGGEDRDYSRQEMDRGEKRGTSDKFRKMLKSFKRDKDTEPSSSGRDGDTEGSRGGDGNGHSRASPTRGEQMDEKRETDERKTAAAAVEPVNGAPPPAAEPEDQEEDEPVAEDALSMLMDDGEAEEERKLAERKRRRQELLAKHAQTAPQPPPASRATAATPAVATPPPGAIPAPEPPSSAGAAEAEKEESKGRAAADLGFDIFSSEPQQTPGKRATVAQLGLDEGDDPNLQSNWDDGEGYYRTRIGEVITGRYQVRGALGKGIFSTVLSCIDQQTEGTRPVAIKMIRNNDVMRKAAAKEMEILQEIAAKDPENKKHCVLLLTNFEHKSHTALVFESYAMNLRETLKKFGKNVGINIKSVRLYARQLFIALRHIASLRIVHADIKPDNILVSEDFRTLKLCDFGSAFKETDPDNDPTPYLVSRFYRAPEITLGLEYDRRIDLWSVGTCLFELFTGSVMFPGRDNNHMLQVFMDMKGRFPVRMLKRHIASYEGMQRIPHFADDFRFRQQTVDKVTGKGVVRFVDIPPQAAGTLKKALMASKAGADDQKLVVDLADLLEKVLSLDPDKRLTVREALEHPFVKAK